MTIKLARTVPAIWDPVYAEHSTCPRCKWDRTIDGKPVSLTYAACCGDDFHCPHGDDTRFPRIADRMPKHDGTGYHCWHGIARSNCVCPDHQEKVAAALAVVDAWELQNAREDLESALSEIRYLRREVANGEADRIDRERLDEVEGYLEGYEEAVLALESPEEYAALVAQREREAAEQAAAELVGCIVDAVRLLQDEGFTVVPPASTA